MSMTFNGHTLKCPACGNTKNISISQADSRGGTGQCLKRGCGATITIPAAGS